MARRPRGQRGRRRKSIFDEILQDMTDLFNDVYEQVHEAQDYNHGYDDQYRGDYSGGPSTESVDIQPVAPLTVEENQLYVEIVELGFREAIKKYHPDRGGDPEKAACINALRDKIHLIAGVKK